MNKTTLLTFSNNALIFIWGIFFLSLPFLLTTATTDVFILPKQLGLIAVVLLSLLLWTVHIIATEKVTFRRTPFDVPVFLFMLALVLSAVFSPNKADSIMAITPVLLAGFGFYILTNTFRKENSLLFALSALVVGGALASLLAVFSFLKVYPLFFPFTHTPSFTPFGSLLEQAFYLGFLLPVSLALALPLLKGKTNNRTVLFSATSVILAAGLVVTLFQLFTTQKPLLLPFETGFQTAFAAISQDTGRIAQGFLFGSGYGNFGAVFTRFKQASFNANAALWNVQFTSSSSFLLELLATTGILGLLSFLFLIFRAVANPSKKKKNPIFLAIVVLGLLCIIFPFSFLEVMMVFVLIGLFAGIQGLKDTKAYYDVELKFVTLKKGFINLQQVVVPSHEKHEYNRVTSITIGIILVAIVIAVGWFAGTYTYANILFQKSLVLAAANNGTSTYDNQVKAISIFPYQSAYYRIFSQTNIALAGSLARIQPKNSSPSAQTQSTMVALIQQGITTAKTATNISPENVANWQNLSSVYRSLIGLGQNAEQFAILASQQSVVLDPTNPQEYIALGGIYYQLQQWDNAIQAFQRAVALKQDYPNAYYNLGHAYEAKGDYQDALQAYQAVKTLVANDKANTDTINKDIEAVQSKMGNPNQQAPTPTPEPKLTPRPTTEPVQPLKLNGEQQGPAGNSATPTVASPAPAQ